MANPRRSATVMQSIAAIEADRGPDLEKYAVPLDSPRMFKWVVGNTDTADSFVTLAHTSGTTGRWLDVPCPDKGSDLTDASVTITVGQKFWRVLPAATLTANRTITLGTTNARAGHTLELTRLDSTAFTLAIVNGGPLAGTLVTLPASERWWAKFYFNGADWVRRAEAKLI